MKKLLLLTIFLISFYQNVLAFNLKSSNSKSYKLLAGLIGGQGTIDGTGSRAYLDTPDSLLSDSLGNIYVTEPASCVIRKITPSGQMTTHSGVMKSCVATDGTRADARWHSPRGMAFDSSGNMYVADTFAHRIRKMTPSGVVSTLAGGSTSGSADGVGSVATFNVPRGVALDSANNIFVADSANNLIRKITPSGDVTTFAGAVGAPGSTDGNGTTARFNAPRSIAVDSLGNIFVVDSANHAIRKITPTGDVTLFAGTSGTSGSSDGVGASARFLLPSSIAIDSTDNLYIADTGNRTIRKITPTATVSTYAGSAGLSGNTDGVGSAARFTNLVGIAVDLSGNLYAVDSTSHIIRKIAPDTTVTTLAGSAGSSGNTDGTGASARFNFPRGVAVSSSGDLYIVDGSQSSFLLRKVTPVGVVKTVSGQINLKGVSLGPVRTASLGNTKYITIRNDVMYLTSDNAVIYAPVP